MHSQAHTKEDIVGNFKTFMHFLTDIPNNEFLQHK